MIEHLVSIIIPIYNTEKYLERCLISIINQSYKNIEIILVNDGSTDKSSEICKKFVEKDNRIQLITQSNGGVSKARNVGLSYAHGEYVIFIDSDDYIDRNMIKLMLDKAIEKKCDIVKCGYYLNKKYVDEKKYLNNNYNKNIILKNDLSIIENIVNYNISPALWMIMIKYDLIKKHKFKENIGYGEDLIYTLDLMLDAKSICFINEYLYFYELSDNSASRDIKKMDRNIQNLLILYDEIKKILIANEIFNINILKNSLKTYYYMIIWFEYLKYEKNIITKKEFINNIRNHRNNDDYKKELKYVRYGNDLKFNRCIIMWLFDLKFYNLIFVILNIKRIVKKVLK